MLLLIDAGNTRIKWALVDPAQAGWRDAGAVTHAGLATLAPAWQCSGATRAVIANVAGPALRAELEQLLPELLPGIVLHWFVSVPVCAGIRNGYRDPAQLGCDRFAAMIGARARFPAHALLVVTCGTATTIDAVTADGVFIGGLILPGLGMMTTSLARQTAQLPQVDAAATPPLFADHTEAAILSGCLAAQAGAIERALAAHPGARCVLSGGAASHVAAALNAPYRLVDNLVLLGLQAAHCTPPSC